jgi:hypothetical protein
MTLAIDIDRPAAEQHQALRASRRELAYFDDNRDAYERRDRVHHLTRIGMSDDEIAVVVGIAERNVTRHRGKPPAPRRPRLYNGAAVSDERAAELEACADLALRLSVVLRDEDPTIVWGALTRLSSRQLKELAVIALASIPIDATPGELLAWVNDLPAAQDRA